MAFGSDRLWQIISALGALLAVFVTVVLYYFAVQEQTKKLEAVVLSKTSLINPNIGSARSKLRVFYQDKEVYNVSIIQVRLRNSGAQPIKAVDIEDPIKINLQGIEELISAEIIDTKPQELPIKPSLEGKSVILNKMLLNSEDQFIVEIVSVQVPNKETSVQGVRARISGVKEIDFRSTPAVVSRMFDLKRNIGMVMAASTIAMLVFTMMLRLREYRSDSEIKRTAK